MSEWFGAGTLFVLAALAVLLLGAAAAFLRRRGGGDPHTVDLDTESPSVRVKGRLEVVESTPVDARRRLVLVRCDDVEHLMLVGGAADVVIRSEPAKTRAPAVRAQQTPLAVPVSTYPAPTAPDGISDVVPAPLSTPARRPARSTPSEPRVQEPSTPPPGASAEDAAQPIGPAARPTAAPARPGNGRRAVAPAPPVPSPPLPGLPGEANAAPSAPAPPPLVPRNGPIGPQRESAPPADLQPGANIRRPEPQRPESQRPEPQRPPGPARPQASAVERPRMNRPQAGNANEGRPERGAPPPLPLPAREQGAAPPANAPRPPAEGQPAPANRGGLPSGQRNPAPAPAAPIRPDRPAAASREVQQPPTLPPAQVPWPEPAAPHAEARNAGRVNPAQQAGAPRPGQRQEAAGRGPAEPGTTLGDLAERLEEALAREVHGDRRPGPGQPEYDLGGFGLGGEGPDPRQNAAAPQPPAPGAGGQPGPARAMPAAPAPAVPADRAIARSEANEREAPKVMNPAPEPDARRGDPRPPGERPEEVPVISLNARRRDAVDPLEDEMARLLGELTGDTNRR